MIFVEVRIKLKFDFVWCGNLFFFNWNVRCDDRDCVIMIGVCFLCDFDFIFELGGFEMIVGWLIECKVFCEF